MAALRVSAILCRLIPIEHCVSGSNEEKNEEKGYNIKIKGGRKPGALNTR
jgi:hypothetical protein